jgi:hypothetical protein
MRLQPVVHGRDLSEEQGLLLKHGGLLLLQGPQLGEEEVHLASLRIDLRAEHGCRCSDGI